VAALRSASGRLTSVIFNSIRNWASRFFSCERKRAAVLDCCSQKIMFRCCLKLNNSVSCWAQQGIEPGYSLGNLVHDGPRGDEALLAAHPDEFLHRQVQVTLHVLGLVGGSGELEDGGAGYHVSLQTRAFRGLRELHSSRSMARSRRSSPVMSSSCVPNTAMASLLTGLPSAKLDAARKRQSTAGAESGRAIRRAIDGDSRGDQQCQGKQEM
jgi:hypothetical protein